MKYLIYFSFFLVCSCNNNKEKVSTESTKTYPDNSWQSSNNTNSYNSSSGNSYYNERTKTNYYSLDDESLIEEFKNYLSDEFLHFSSFKINNKVITITSSAVDNVSVRRLEKNNPDLFNTVLSRYNKIIFYDDLLGDKVVLKPKTLEQLFK